MDNQLYNQTIGAILNIVQILLPLGSAFYGFYKVGGVKYIKSKIGLISDKRTRDLVNDGFDRIVELLDTEITNAESFAKPLILKKIAEGQLSKDSLASIGVEVAKSVMNQLPEKTINLLQQEVNDVGVYVNKKLEQRLDKLKQDPNSGVSKTIVEVPTQIVIDTIELQNKLNKTQADKDNLTAQNSTLQSNTDTLNQANSNLSQKAEQIQLENDTLKAQLSQVQSTLQSLVKPVSNELIVDTLTPIVVNELNI